MQTSSGLAVAQKQPIVRRCLV